MLSLRVTCAVMYFRKALVTMADASAKPNRLWSVNTVAPTSQTAPMN